MYMCVLLSQFWKLVHHAKHVKESNTTTPTTTTTTTIIIIIIITTSTVTPAAVDFIGLFVV